ncbi:unnamed protein product [Rotaria socialis]
MVEKNSPETTDILLFNNVAEQFETYRHRLRPRHLVEKINITSNSKILDDVDEQHYEINENDDFDGNEKCKDDDDDENDDEQKQTVQHTINQERNKIHEVVRRNENNANHNLDQPRRCNQDI